MTLDQAEADRALALAVGHINVSAPRQVSASAMLAALQAKTIPPDMLVPVRALLDETDVETLSDLVRSGVIGYGQLAHHAAGVLEPNHETRLWLEANV